MSQSELYPQVLVSATIGESAKLLALPSDAARWGWIRVLGSAKLRHPQGRFESRAVLAACIGRYDRFVAAYLAAGLLHRGSALCPDCQAVSPGVRPDELVVHDWAKHQLSRAQRWRLEQGLTSGHHATPGKHRGNTGETGGETEGETEGKHQGNPRARDTRPWAPSPSHSLYPRSDSPTIRAGDGGGGPGEGDDPLAAVEAHLAARGCAVDPGGKAGVELARLVDRHGPDAVIGAIDALPGPITDGRQAVYGALRILAPIPDVRPSRGYERSVEEVERAIVR